VATPAQALTVLALNFYGLLGFFLAQVWWMRHDTWLDRPAEQAVNQDGTAAEHDAPLAAPVGQAWEGR
jgi:hypothetical protein